MRNLAKLLALCALSLTSCMSVGVDLAPSTTPLRDGEYTELADMSEGTSWGAMIWFIPASEGAVTKSARDRAIENGGADALVNVSCSTTIYFLPFVTLFKTIVRGTPVAINE